MTTPIIAFLVFGACFGLATYSRRHLFSEGATQRSAGARDAADGRLLWVLICSCLWPLMALTGVISAVRLARAPARPAERRP